MESELSLPPVLAPRLARLSFRSVRESGRVTEQGNSGREPTSSRTSGLHPLTASRTRKKLSRSLIQPHTQCESLSKTSAHHHSPRPALSVTLWPEAATH